MPEQEQNHLPKVADDFEKGQNSWQYIEKQLRSKLSMLSWKICIH